MAIQDVINFKCDITAGDQQRRINVESMATSITRGPNELTIATLRQG